MMKRKLRPWVKVTAAVIWLTGLSAAASCTSGNIPAAASRPGQKLPGETALKDMPDDSAFPVNTPEKHKSRAQKEGETVLLVPKLFKEVVNI